MQRRQTCLPHLHSLAGMQTTELTTEAVGEEEKASRRTIETAAPTAVPNTSGYARIRADTRPEASGTMTSPACLSLHAKEHQ